MKHHALSGLTALLTLSGCVESALNPNDAVVMSGTVLRENRSPLTDTTLKLLRGPNSACVFAEDYRDVKTDSVGRYSLELTGAETQTRDDIARCFNLKVPADEKGASVNAEFLMQVTKVDVPDLQLWNGAVEAAQRGAGAQITFKKIADTHSFDSEASLVITKDSDVVWQSAASSSPVLISEYVLEDFAGVKTQLGIDREVKGSGTTFHIHYGSNSVEVPHAPRVPASRGAACKLGAKSFDTCPYTDGKLAPNAEDAAAQLVVNLPAAKKLTRLVLRNFHYNIATAVLFEGSTDGGATWVKLGELPNSGSTDYVELALDASAPAVNAFRIHLQGNNDPKILQLSEVSLFE